MVRLLFDCYLAAHLLGCNLGYTHSNCILSNRANVMHKVHAKQTFNVPVSQLFDYLSVHSNLDILFAPVKSTLLRAGTASTYGVGSVRRMVGPFGTFEETTTVSEPYTRIEYKITQGSPLKHHHGTMIFTGDATQCTLDYTIVFAGKLPLIGYIIQTALQKSVSAGLARLAANNLQG